MSFVDDTRPEDTEGPAAPATTTRLLQGSMTWQCLAHPGLLRNSAGQSHVRHHLCAPLILHSMQHYYPPTASTKPAANVTFAWRVQPDPTERQLNAQGLSGSKPRCWLTPQCQQWVVTVVKQTPRKGTRAENSTAPGSAAQEQVHMQ